VEPDSFHDALKGCPEMHFILSGNTITPRTLIKIVQKLGEIVRFFVYLLGLFLSPGGLCTMDGQGRKPFAAEPWMACPGAKRKSPRRK